MTMKAIINELSSLDWYLFKKERQYGDHGTTCTGYIYYFYNKPKQYIAIIDNGNIKTLLSWHLVGCKMLPRGLHQELNALDITLPNNLCKQTHTDYTSVNKLLTSVHKDFYAILSNYSQNLSCPDCQHIKQARHIINRILHNRKWHHNHNEGQQYVVVANIDNFSNNYSSDDKIFNLVKKVQSKSGLQYTTQKYSYNQLRRNKNVVFQSFNQANHQRNKLDENGPKATVVTLQHLLDKYEYLIK